MSYGNQSKVRRITRNEAIRFFQEAAWETMSSDILEKIINVLRERYAPFDDEHTCKIVQDEILMDVHHDYCAWHLLHMCQEDEPTK